MFVLLTLETKKLEANGHGNIYFQFDEYKPIYIYIYIYMTPA